MNILVNPGFEDGEVGWQFYTGAALLEDGSGIDGGNCAQIAAARYGTGFPPGPPYTTVEGKIVQQPTEEVGTLYSVSARVKNTLPWGTLEITVAGVPVAAVSSSEAVDWRLVSGLWLCTGPGGYAVTAKIGDGTGISYWLVDNCEMTIEGRNMARSVYNSYSALFNKLKDINGSTDGYYNNIASQVIPRLVLPSEPGAPKMPYICLPLSDTGSYEGSERGVRAALRQSIIAFIPESEANDVADSSAVKALKMHDDIVRCLMPETGNQWHLNDEYVEDVSLVAKEIVAGQNDGIPWAEVNVTVDVYTRFGRGDLGPDA